ncbi:MAG: diguanylate cyclase [Anaerolineales bacterium]|nr:diguanylate cyclase [Anaerolineales bacterium]
MEDNPTILIVDDDPNLRKTLSDILLAKGYRPLPVSGGTSALVTFNEDQPALALIDLKMEDMSGLELLAKIRGRFPSTECIVLTGHASRETAIEAINLGAYSYVEKPYDMDQLLLTIRRAIEKRTAGVELRNLKEFNENIVQRMMEGIVVEDAKGYVTFVNPATATLLGYEQEELMGKHWTEFCPVDQRAIIEAANERREQGIATDRYEVELLRKDGTRVPVLVSGSVLLEGDLQVGTLAVFTDITERKRTEEKLRYMSIHDVLTGIYNRGYFEEEMARLERGRQFPISVVMVDIDDLKVINDTLGHEAGDETLRRSATVLRKIFRADDVVARIGGDEFAVLLPGSDADVVETAVERLRREIEEHNIQHEKNPLSLSIGSATIHRGESVTSAMRDADKQMYEEKLSKGGRPRWKTNPLWSENSN